MAKITPKEMPKKLRKQISLRRIMEMIQFIAICYLVYCQLR